MRKKYPTSVCYCGQNGIEIELIKEFCKGCGICVEFCPKDVLALGKDLKVEVINVEACSGDRLCEFRCPDLAIFVRKKKKEG
ncbi:MAG: 4Fe-4S binding protein [candidate division WOR-3 bacterium]